MKKVLITGTAGFIGFHMAKKMLGEGWSVLGVDSLNNYYDVNLKIRRNEILSEYSDYSFEKVDISNFAQIFKVVETFKPEIVIHLAAQAGVRYSIEDPKAYIQSNIVGTFNLLESIKSLSCKHFLFASTSSVYGSIKELPYSESQKADTPMSFYAATKKSNEAMIHSYSHLNNIPSTCMRFFTVYGPWGRPDMALFKFIELITKGKTIEIYNNGKMTRDFTYIDDLIESVFRLTNVPPKSGSSQPVSDTNVDLSNCAPFRVVNIASANPKKLEQFIKSIEENLGIVAKKNFIGIQPGDVPETAADTSLLKNLTDYQPDTDLCKGIKSFVDWYKDYYNINLSKASK